VYLLILALFCIHSYSQDNEKTVILMDKEFDTPIEDASITVLRTNQGFISNKEGVFKINLKRPSIIEISHVFYKDLRISSNSLKENVNIIYLESNASNLEEIVITKKDPQDILKSLVNNSRKKITVPANLKVYTREFFKKNDIYTYYNDGLLNFQILEDNDKVKTDILVEQNRSVGFIDTFDKSILGYDLNNLMENYYMFVYLEELLHAKAKKMYSFQIKSYAHNDSYNYVIVRPLTLVHGELYEYSILYDSKNELIMEVSSILPIDRISKDRSLLDFNKKNVFKSEFKNTYRYESHRYYLANSKEEIGFVVKSGKKEIKIEIKNYLITTEFRPKTFRYKDEEIYKGKSLINKTNSILTDYWEQDSGLILTKPELDIINSLAQ
ncbi:MAG: carboxypeptidase-like regulatory domain-containing protein, partial [Flavobacterium sp.]